VGKHTAYEPDELNRRWSPLWELNVGGVLEAGSPMGDGHRSELPFGYHLPPLVAG
jgi:hypothetical protein